MERPIKKKERTRCTLCKRKRKDAISEQVKEREACDQDLCELAQEIRDAIEESYRIRFTPREKKEIRITKKEIKITKKS